MMADHAGFATLSAVAIGLLLLLTRSNWFWNDEWMFIRDRSFTDPASWFLPHVEHFVALHAAVYTALLAVFGTSTYLPFMTVLLATHVAFVAAIYTLVDRHVGRRPALAAAAILLLLGTAALNMFWAFQMGAVGAGALAMWGLVVIRRRPGLSAILLGLGVATQGFALFFVPAAAIYGRSWRAVLASSVPVFVYGTWYGLIGHGLITQRNQGPTPAGIISWVVEGAGASAASVTGLGQFGAILLLIALVLVMCIRDRQAAIVGIVGILTEYVILGLSRPGLNAPGGWQYVYFGAAFLVLIFASAWPAVPRWGRPAVGLLVGIALVENVNALIEWSTFWPSFIAANDPFCTLC